jgi:hypothetical protein
VTLQVWDLASCVPIYRGRDTGMEHAVAKSFFIGFFLHFEKSRKLIIFITKPNKNGV